VITHWAIQVAGLHQAQAWFSSLCTSIHYRLFQSSSYSHCSTWTSCKVAHAHHPTRVDHCSTAVALSTLTAPFTNVGRMLVWSDAALQSTSRAMCHHTRLDTGEGARWCCRLVQCYDDSQSRLCIACARLSIAGLTPSSCTPRLICTKGCILVHLFATCKVPPMDCILQNLWPTQVPMHCALLSAIRRHVNRQWLSNNP
jgi:hypothetical protein